MWYSWCGAVSRMCDMPMYPLHGGSLRPQAGCTVRGTSAPPVCITPHASLPPQCIQDLTVVAPGASWLPGRRGRTPKVLVSRATGAVEPGRLTAIIGPSGAGKTTLLGMAPGRGLGGAGLALGSMLHVACPVESTACVDAPPATPADALAGRTPAARTHGRVLYAGEKATPAVLARRLAYVEQQGEKGW